MIIVSCVSICFVRFTVRYYGAGVDAVKKSCALVNIIMKSLTSCFTYGSDQLITTTLYKIMSGPLANQVR